jgi:hypothetical protein
MRDLYSSNQWGNDPIRALTQRRHGQTDHAYNKHDQILKECLKLF